MYCQGKNKAIVTYRFKNNASKKFEANSNQLPINVTTGLSGNSQRVSASFSGSFDGSVKRSYGFTCEAPVQVPRNQPVEVYLLSGRWDDHGSCGSYSTGYGIIKTFSGEILIGTTAIITGNVVNEQPVECNYAVTLQWRYGACEINVFDNNQNNIFNDKGDCPVTFNVTCDDECPPGHLKLNSPNYPGYCCIPCSEVVGGIKSITAAVRGINRG